MLQWLRGGLIKPRYAALAVGLAVACTAATAWSGPPPALKFSKRCLMVSLNEGCAVADVDKDGVLDVIAGTHWYAGPDYVPRPLRDIDEVMVEYYNQNGDHPYDVDGDGWIDVISIGWNDPDLCWYKNPGSEKLARGMKWERHVLAVTRKQNECLALRDFDADGVPEVFVNSWDAKAPVVVWKLAKMGGARPTAKRVVLGDQGSGHGFAFGDVNGDGREDILCAPGWYERPAGNPLARPWKFHAETTLPHSSCPFLVVDVNGDGRNDIIWAKAHDLGIFWRAQGPPDASGKTTWQKDRLIDDSWSQAHGLAWSDLDGDGQCELITGKRVRAHNGSDPGGTEPECLYYYVCDRSTRSFSRRTISPPGGGVGAGMQIQVVDLNADGRPDICVAGKTGTWVLINEGPRKLGG